MASSQKKKINGQKLSPRNPDIRLTRQTLNNHLKHAQRTKGNQRNAIATNRDYQLTIKGTK